MECRYCNAPNDEDDHRCSRCGRRLKATAARRAPDTYPITTATAPSLMELYNSVTETGPAVQPEPEPEPAFSSYERVAYQRELFADSRRVVEMPAPIKPQASASAPRQPRQQPNRTAAHRARRVPEGQGKLEFSNGFDTQVEAVIYCDAPVAIPTHRLIATAVDLSLILIGLGVFLLTFNIAGGEVVLNKQTIPLFGGMGVVLGLFYHFLYCIAGGDTPGMQAVRLRLVDFDGREPDREQRFHRLAGSCLSTMAAGLGLIWALVDEESLTWHDHISKTFPTPE